MAEENLLNLNKSINVVKSNVGELAGGIDTLANKFDNLAKVLRIDGYVQLNATYTQLTRSMALSTVEAEKLSKAVDIMSQRVATYSKKELANLVGVLYNSTGTMTMFRGEFDKISERFANKYKKDAEVYAKVLTQLTERMPEVSYAMQRGAKDVETLGHIFRVSGREGISAYLAFIDKIPNETENSLNKTELQVKKLQSTWDNAKINLGRTISTIFDPLVGAANKVGEFAQSNPLATNVVAAGGSAASSIAMMYIQARMIRGAVGGGGLLGGGAAVAGAAATGSAWNAGRGFYTPEATAAPSGLWGMSRAQRVGAGAGIFALGHLGTQALTDEGSTGRFLGNMATNVGAGAMAAGPYGAVAAAIITAGSELVSALNRNAEAVKSREDQNRTARAEYEMRGAVTSEYKLAAEKVKNLPINVPYTQRTDAYADAAKESTKVLKQTEDNITNAKAEQIKIAEKQILEQARIEKGTIGPQAIGGPTTMYTDDAQAAIKELANLNKQMLDENEKVKVGEAQITTVRTRAQEDINNAYASAERGIAVSAAQVGQTQKFMQLSLQYGGAGSEGLGATLGVNLDAQIANIQGKKKTVSSLTPEDIILMDQQIKELEMQKVFAPAEFAAAARMSGAAITAKTALAGAGLAGAQGAGAASTIEAVRAAQVAQLSENISAKQGQADQIAMKIAANPEYTAEGEMKLKEIEGEIASAQLQKLEAMAKAEQDILSLREKDVSVQEKMNQLIDPAAPESILEIMKKRLTIAERLTSAEVTTDAVQRAKYEKEFELQKQQLDYYEKVGKIKAESEQSKQLIDIQEGAYGATGVTTKGRKLAEDLKGAEAEATTLQSMKASGQKVQEQTMNIANAKVKALQVQLELNRAVEQEGEIQAFTVSKLDMQISRMQMLKAPIGIIANLNREKLQEQKEILATAEKELALKEKGGNVTAIIAAKLNVEKARTAVAASLDFERRSYADIFTAQTFGKASGSYLFPAGMSSFALEGGGRTTGWSGYGKQNTGTYSSQIADTFGAGFDERSPMDKLYNSLVKDGIKMQEGTTLLITGFKDDGTAITQVASNAAR